MLRNLLVAGAVLSASGLSGAIPAGAEPTPPPTPPPAPSPTQPPVIPNVFANMPMNPADFTVNGGKWFAFAGPAGVVCMLDTLKGDYGCAGPLPGAPGGANLVSAGPVGIPTFSTTEVPAYAEAGAVKPLPPNTRLTYRQVSCGVDDAGVVACLNSRDQVGFVVGPTGSYIGSNTPAPLPAAGPTIPT